jgi:phosphoribosylaminoimidazole-succinocarboxamide synthase
MGSVKDLEIIRKPEGKRIGLGRFTFSDDYSVFDWGKMPDTIENKGAALCIMGACCFEEAEIEHGINTHYRGLREKDNLDQKILAYALRKPTNIMDVDLVNVIPPTFKDGQYDYSAYNSNLANFLIPLEIIYRNGLPKGSSVFKRLEEKKITYQDLGLDHAPVPGEKLKAPIFDVSTKLEEGDRYITWAEAQKIAGLTSKEVGDIKEVLNYSNEIITNMAKKAGLVNEDGKIELAYNPRRELMLVDVIGTLDECRFTYSGIHISKEVARQFYAKTQWYQDVQEAKKLAKEKGIKDWKSICKSQPPALDPNLKQIISEMYTSTANAFLDNVLFDSPPLKDVAKKYKLWLKHNE